MLSALPFRRAAAALAAMVLVAGLGGCRKRGGGEGSILDRIPADADVVVMLEPRALAATWVAPLVTALARRVEVPACVVARAWAGSRVVVAWSRALPEDGWLVAIADGAAGAGGAGGAAGDRVDAGAGPGAVACEALAVQGGIATWSRAMPVRTGADDGFFDDRGLRARWGQLPARPVRGIAEHELSAGIIAHTDLWLDPRDGVEAQATVRFDSPDAAIGARNRIERWRNALAEERMGGAWPIVTLLAVKGPPRGDAALQLGVRLAGEAGATAAPLFATALAFGADRSDRAPCPLKNTYLRWGLLCKDGEYQVTRHFRDDMFLRAARYFEHDVLTTTTTGGVVDGLRLVSLGGMSPLLGLGFREGDALRTLDGTAIESVDQLAAHARGAAIGSVTVITFIRAGRTLIVRLHLT